MDTGSVDDLDNTKYPRTERWDMSVASVCSSSGGGVCVVGVVDDAAAIVVGEEKLAADASSDGYASMALLDPMKGEIEDNSPWLLVLAGMSELGSDRRPTKPEARHFLQ